MFQYIQTNLSLSLYLSLSPGRGPGAPVQPGGAPRAFNQERAVGFHNFNLRNFNLRVSKSNKFIVDMFFDTMSDFNVPGSRPKKHDEISEIDRTQILGSTQRPCV